MRPTHTLSLAITMAFAVSASAQLTTYSTNGSATVLEDGCVELISGQMGMASSVWAEKRLDLSQPFHIQANLNFGSIPHGSEGMVWTLHAEDFEVSMYSELETAFGVEFDTRPQPELGDIETDHIAMINHGSYVHLDSTDAFTAGPVSALMSGESLEDGNDHLVDIVWEPNGPEIRVYLDCEERLVASIDLIDDIFHGQRHVTWGFAAEATNAVNVGRVCLTGNATGTDTEIYACPEAAVQLVAGGLNVSEYVWSPSNVVSDATLQAPIYTGVTSNTLTVMYTNQCGLSITDEVHIVMEEVSVTLTSDGDALTCYNDGILACQAVSEFGDHVDYTWKINNSVVGHGTTLNLDAPGTLEIEVAYPGTSSLLCSDAFSMTVLVDTTHLNIDAGQSRTITCTNPNIELTGVIADNANADVVWTTEDGSFEGSTNNPTAYATSAGIYVMTATNLDNGCISSDEVMMNEDTELPEVTLGTLDGVLDCDVHHISMTGNDIFPQEYTPVLSWIDEETGEIIATDVHPVFESAGTYTLHVEFVENGCVTTLEEAVQVHSDVEVLDLSEMVLPNVITPDFSGTNDRFAPFVPGREDVNVLLMLDSYYIQVYNRWGDVLFKNDGLPLQWDGRANGNLVDPGSYIVAVTYETTCGGIQTGELRTTLEVIY